MIATSLPEGPPEGLKDRTSASIDDLPRLQEILESMAGATKYRKDAGSRNLGLLGYGVSIGAAI